MVRTPERQKMKHPMAKLTTTYLNHNCVNKLRPMSMHQIIEDSDSYAFWVLFYFIFFLLENLGFGTLLYLKPTNHYSSNETNDQMYQIMCC